MYHVWVNGEHKANLFPLYGGNRFYLQPFGHEVSQYYFSVEFPEMKRILRSMYGAGVLKYRDPKEMLKQSSPQ